MDAGNSRAGSGKAKSSGEIRPEKIKSEVIRSESPGHALSQAWVKELRTHNATKKIFTADPYAEVYRFRENLFGIYTENADGMADPWIFLVIGPEKALLIDNGFGIGNLKKLAEELAGGREIIAVITHAHPDHAYGSCQFEKVFAHEFNRFQLEKLQSPAMWDYLFDGNGKPRWLRFDRKDIIPFRECEFCYCDDGYVFDLGEGYEIEMIHSPGHSSGHCAFLDKRDRILFAGDSIVSSSIRACGAETPDPNADAATLTSYRESIRRFIVRENEFDSIFPGHFIVDIGKEVLTDILDTCNAILDNPNDYDFLTKEWGKESYHKFVRGLGNISYSMDQI